MNSYNSNDLQRLIGKLQAEDERNTNLYKGFRCFFIILSVVYLVFGGISYVRGAGIYVALSFVADVCALLICSRVMEIHVGMYGRVNYSEPTLQMLKLAKLRYRFFPSRAVGYMFSTLCFLFLSFLLNAWENEERVETILCIFFCSLLLGISIGAIWWCFRDKPIYDNIKALIDDLESN